MTSSRSVRRARALRPSPDRWAPPAGRRTGPTSGGGRVDSGCAAGARDRWRSAVVVAGRGWVSGGGRARLVDEVDHAVLLEAVARSLRGGQSLSGASIEAGRTGGAGRAADQLARLGPPAGGGAGDRGRGRALGREHDPDQARLLAGAALALGAEVGGAHARSLDAAAASLRDRAGLQREVRALTSQARASAGVMVLAPLGFAAFTSITEPAGGPRAGGHPARLGVRGRRPGAGPGRRLVDGATGRAAQVTAPAAAPRVLAAVAPPCWACAPATIPRGVPARPRASAPAPADARRSIPAGAVDDRARSALAGRWPSWSGGRLVGPVPAAVAGVGPVAGSGRVTRPPRRADARRRASARP